MSVLALDTRTNKYYVFAKGAPEVIHRHSINKFQYFEQLLQTESYGGFRTIGYGFKEIDVKDLEENLGASRSSHLNQIQMMGLLVF
jgi:magnesium-transporting ATPase (P-type)